MHQSPLLRLVLKLAGYRRGSSTRRSSRSKRWSRSAQTLFASWAVLGQLGGMGLLVGEAIQPSAAQADITDIPGARGGENGTANASEEGAFAIGVSASADGIGAMSVGSNATAIGNYAVATGYEASAGVEGTAIEIGA